MRELDNLGNVQRQRTSQLNVITFRSRIRNLQKDVLGSDHNLLAFQMIVQQYPVYCYTIISAGISYLSECNDILSFRLEEL